MADKPPATAQAALLEGFRRGLAGGDVAGVDARTRELREHVRAELQDSNREAPVSEAAVAGADKPKRKAPRRTSLDRIPGRRQMKEYPVTGEELLSLGIMQAAATIMLAFAGTCFGFYVSTKQTIDFAGKEVPASTIGWWSGMGDAAFALAIVTVVLGLALVALSGLKVKRVMDGTDHG